jgi:AMP-polyphosphate phosphotransferase
MVERTSHDIAPWRLIAAEDKRWARVAVIEAVIAAIEEGLVRHGMAVPPAHRAGKKGGTKGLRPTR